MPSKISHWMDVALLHKRNMDQLISQMKEEKCFLKKGQKKKS